MRETEKSKIDKVFEAILEADFIETDCFQIGSQRTVTLFHGATPKQKHCVMLFEFNGGFETFVRLNDENSIAKEFEAIAKLKP
jgi:hypothetical protein